MANFRPFRRSFSDFKRHPWLHLVSISTITIALLILGGFLLCHRNFENLAEKTNPAVTGTLYLRDSLPEAEIQALRQRVMSVDHVQRVVFKSKTSVVGELQAFLGSAGTEVIPGSELFPDVLEIEIKKDAGTQAIYLIKTILSKFPEVAEVDFSDDWLVQYKKIRHFLKIFGFFLMGAIIVGCSFIIANFMGMRHQARKSEIEIIRLHGAHRNFILAPFLAEGVIEGIMGALIALMLLFFAKVFLSSLLSVQWTALLGVKSWLFLSASQGIMVVLVGIAMAIFGSLTVFIRFQENELK